MRPGAPAARRLSPAALALVTGLVAAACASNPPLLPADVGVPFPDYSSAHAEASAACRAVRTFSAELGLAGRVADQPIRGRMLGGFEQPASLRLVGLAPFGPPAFILAATSAETVLYLPRDQRVLRGATATDILDAIAGVALAPADLLAVLTGCVTTAPRPVDGRLHRNGWVAVDLVGGATVYLEPGNGTWRPRAARREEWIIEYPGFPGTFPAEVVLRSAGRVEMTARVTQLEANAAIDPEAFSIAVPAWVIPITLEELRAAGPLRATRAGDVP
jgi:hypothetical protein